MFIVPQGFSDLLPGKAEVFYFVRDKLVKLFQSHGYLPLVPPTIELLDTYTLSGEREEETFNFIDHAESKTACFRYDFTPQVARILSNYRFSLPVKFCYDGVVLRKSRKLSGEKREIYQSGVEIVGDGTDFADLELILLAEKIFRTLEIKSFRIFLSDVGIIRSLFNKSEVPSELRKAFIEKNITEIKIIADKLDINSEKKKFLSDLPLMCGGEELISDIEKQYKIEEIKPYLKRLKKIAQEANKSGITVEFDLGEVRGFEYHSGVILDCYAEDKDNRYQEVITGGRYDNLLTAYLGSAVAATGFAVDVTKLCSCVNYSPVPSLLLVAEETSDIADVQRVAELFRNHGVKVNILNTLKIDEYLTNWKGSYDFMIIFDSSTRKVLNLKTKTEKVVKKITSDFIKNFLKDVLK
ncbi:MAG: ATP phosphoribosyltransferase regulatory subunit [bacterium]